MPGVDELMVIIDAIPASVAYIDSTEYFRVANHAFRSLYGPLFGDVVGHHLRDVFGPAGYDVIRPHLARALAGHPVSYEARLPLPDGTVRWIQANYIPHHGEDGVSGFISELHDVTARKRTEERLEILADASKALGTCHDRATALRTIASVAVPALADWGAIYMPQGGSFEPTEVGCVPYLPREQIWELARGLSPEVSHAPATLPFARGSGVSVGLIARGEPLGVLVLGSLQGHRWEADDLALVEELGRRASAALEIAILLEQQRDAVEQLQEVDRRKDEFLAVLGHELRNPLAPIVTALDLMAFRGAGYDRERDVIRRQTDYMTRLVDDLLDISRITRGKIDLRKEPVDISDVIAKAIELASPLLEQRAHQLTVDVPPGHVVDADPVRLAQVFTNLIANAAKYSHPRAKIEVAVRRVDGEIIATVTDDGPGIPAELLPTVFDPFVQGTRRLERSQGGLGLGLALVRSLTVLHGGRATVASDSNGSRFTITLPAACAPSIGKEPGKTSGRLLVVDNNVDAAVMIAELLRTLGYDVAIAHDAPTALQIARDFRPAIALLDLGLPVMDGYELARHLGSQLADPPRLVAVTGYGQHQDVQRSRAAGFEVQLGKPVDFAQLASVLGRLAPS